MDKANPSQSNSDGLEKPPEDPRVDWTSYHEQNNEPVDVGAMAALVRRVGGELQKIDSQSVSNSTQKAERIDKQKLITDLSSNSPSTPVTTSASPPMTAPPPMTGPPPSTGGITTHPMESAIKVTPQQHIPTHKNVDIEKLQKRLDRLESSTRAFRKTKKIKRGTSYRVSSNSVKGVLKDAELVAEFVISELAKGVKSITIKLDESTDT